jgi:hypothetical protein
MGKGQDEFYRSILDAFSTPPSSLGRLASLGSAPLVRPPAPPTSTGYLGVIGRPLNNLRSLAALGSLIPPPGPQSPGGSIISGPPVLGTRLGALGRIAMLPPPPKLAPAPEHGVQWARETVGSLLKQKASVRDGRVLPAIEDLAVMEGRRIRAAFVYSDLHGFTKLVATQPENKSFVFLQAFIEIASQVTKRYGGEVIGCRGGSGAIGLPAPS